MEALKNTGEFVSYYFAMFMNHEYTQKTIEFVDVHFYEILMYIYIYLFFRALYLMHKQNKKIAEMKGDMLGLITAGKFAIELGKKLNEENKKIGDKLTELRTKRDKKYRKNNSSIYYWKRRFIALNLCIKDNFKNAPHFVKLIQNDFYDLQKLTIPKLEEMEENLAKKSK